MASLRSPVTISGIVAAVAIVAYILIPLEGDHTWLGIAGCLALFVAAVPVMFRALDRVNHSDRPVIEALAFLGAVGVLAIVVPASVYVATVDVAPGSFKGLETKVDGVYFTVTVLSTVGFGDIQPTSQGARILTTTHMLLSIGLLGSVFRMVSRVVGAKVTERRDDDSS